MWKKIQQVLDRLESRWALYSLLGVGGTISAISGWIAAKTAWLSAYGAITWWFAALLGGALFAFTFLAIAWGRWKFIQARSIDKWARNVDAVNPMEREFRNQRLNLADLANPISKIIEGKRFIGCELIGPVTILLGPTNSFRKSHFFRVNMIPLKDNVPMAPIYTMVGCEIIESQIMDANILFPRRIVPVLEAGFPPGALSYVGLTGFAEIDNRGFNTEE
ncbi:hypothetical protein [Tardibacter chloracetimidivorans]|nr:hypothetical protein [Tardibacter chloracetimidivorans]